MGTIHRLGMAVLVTGMASGAGLRAKPATPVPVTSELSDFDSGVAPSLQIQSDQKGTYANGTQALSVITTAPGDAHAAGDWVLDTTLKRSSRRIYLNFGQPIPGSAPNGGDPPALPSGLYTASIKANCDLEGTNLLTMTASSVATCPVAIVFTLSGATYSLHMNPGVTTNGIVQWPETNDAKVTCVFPTSGTAPCSEWKFEPSASYTTTGGAIAEGSRAKLLLGTANDNGVDQGDYNFSFLFLVMK